MKNKLFKKHKAISKTLVFKWVSIVLIIVGICLIGYTIKAIFFKPDYSIKTEYYVDLNAEGSVSLPALHNEKSSDVAKINESISDVPEIKENLNQVPEIEEMIETVVVSYEEGDYIGELFIPSLDYELPIYEGTTNSELRKGVGRYIGSAQPGEADNCVLSGHRDTVFSKLGDLKLGETIIVKSELGLFSYEVKEIRIVDEDDRTVIVPYDEATLTLTTCYPFDEIGFAPQRYIVSAKMIQLKSLE